MYFNFKQGCTKSAHNNEKPAEPEKAEVDKSKANEVIEYKIPEPIKPSTLERPPFESPLTKLKYSVSASLKQELEKAKATEDPNPIVTYSSSSNNIRVGASCKHGGCQLVILQTEHRKLAFV